MPAGRILSAVIHNGQPSDIESSMVDGRFIMRDRKVLTMDEDRIVAEADKVGRRIWNKVLESQDRCPFPAARDATASCTRRSLSARKRSRHRTGAPASTLLSAVTLEAALRSIPRLLTPEDVR